MSMKTFEDEKVCLIDLKPNWVLIKDNDETKMAIEDEDRDTLYSGVLGIMTIEVSRDEVIPYVDRIWAIKGWGALLHYIGLYLYRENGLAPTRRANQLKPAASKVWDKMFNDDRFTHEKIKPIHGSEVYDSLYKMSDDGLLSYMSSNIKMCSLKDDWLESVIEEKISDEMDVAYDLVESINALFYGSM